MGVVGRSSAVPDRQFRNPRWLPCLNAYTEEIPPYSLVEVTAGDDDAIYSVKQPTEDNMTGIIGITGPAKIPGSGYGEVAFCGNIPLPVIYAGAAPAVGDIMGTAAGSFELTAAKTGFKVLGVPTNAAGLKIALVREVAGARFPFFSHFATLKQDSPSTTYYDTGFASDKRVKDWWTGTDKYQWQLWLELDRAVANLRDICLPMSHIIQACTWTNVKITAGCAGSSSPPGTNPFTHRIRMALLKTQIPVNVTWDSGHHSTRHLATHGAFWDTPGNFVDIPAPALRGGLNDFTVTGMPDPSTGTFNTDLEAHAADLYLEDDGVNDNLANAAGPFWGVALFFDVIWPGGLWDDPSIMYAATSSVEAEVETLLATPAERARGFVIDNSIGVVNP